MGAGQKMSSYQVQESVRLVQSSVLFLAVWGWYRRYRRLKREHRFVRLFPLLIFLSFFVPMSAFTPFCYLR